jgi:hypothetical protein
VTSTTLRSLLALVVLSSSFLACPRPVPTPDGSPSVTPRSWADTADTIVTSCRWALPAIKGICNLMPDSAIPAPVKAEIGRAIDAIQADTLPALVNALATYRARAGDGCAVYAATGALRVALTGVCTTIANQGFGIGSDIAAILGNVGGVLDGLIPACQNDAGFYSTGRSIRDEITGLETLAASHGARGTLDLSTWDAGTPAATPAAPTPTPAASH